MSRVGGKTQVPAMRELAGTLRLEYAQFLELEMFTRFGSMIDERTRERIEHGKRIRAALRQEELAPISLSVQVGVLLALAEGLLDQIPPARVSQFRADLGEALLQDCPREAARVSATGELVDEDRAAFLKAASRVVESHSSNASDKAER